MTVRALLLPAALLLAGCSGDGIPEANADAFVDEVRATVPGASSYSDDELLNMAESVCELGSTDQGVDVLDGYDRFETTDLERLAYIALTEACPERSGSTRR